MAAKTFTKLNGFVEHWAEKVHNLGSDALTLALTNSDPTSALNASTAACVLANVTEVSYTYCSTRALGSITSAQSSGTYTLDAANITLTATGGAVGPFRYIVLYNDTPSSPADPCIGLWDYGSALTLNDGDSLEILFDAAGILTNA